MQNDLDKCYVAWQAADNTVTVLEADIVAADAAADVAEAKRKSYSQVSVDACLMSVCAVCCHSSSIVPC